MQLKGFHHRWLRIACVAMATLAVVSEASAAVIPGTQILLERASPQSDSYFATILQTPKDASAVNNETGVWLGYSGSTLRAITWTPDEGSDWYLARAGDVFSPETIAANQFPLLIRDEPGKPVVFGPTAAIPLGAIYLAANTGGLDGYPIRGVFGWIEINNTGSDLVAIDNAVAYGEGGIIVGATMAVPEPATVLVMLGGTAVLVLMRCAGGGRGVGRGFVR